MDVQEYEGITNFLQRGGYPHAIRRNTNLKRNFRRKCYDYFLKDDELFKARKTGTQKALRVLKKTEVEKVMESIHAVSGGHLGVTRTLVHIHLFNRLFSFHLS